MKTREISLKNLHFLVIF